MRILNNGISILAAIMLLLGGCKDKTEAVIPEYLSTKEIPDWNEIYPLLLSRALEWDPDARLDIAVVNINWQNHPEKRLVSAFFQTPNKEFETLHLKYLKDGTIEANVNSHGVPIPSFDPIERTEWNLNSTAAWDLLLQNPDVVSHDSKFFECSSLMLMKKEIRNEEKVLIWQLALADCEHTVSILYFVDASSGDFLGVETH
jgi:hypothetical protein